MGRAGRLWRFLRGLVRRLAPPRAEPPSVVGTQIPVNNGIVIVTTHIHVHLPAPPLPVQERVPALPDEGQPDP